MPLRFARTLFLLALSCAGLVARAAELTVSTAASLGSAFAELAPLFETSEPGAKVRLNLAASGALLQQIAKGAPVDVFISADQETMDQAQAQGLVQAAQRRNIVANALVVVVPSASRAEISAMADLTRPAFARIAIGLPASVPAGRYARSALEAAQLWPALAPKTIGAHNVRQALDYVARGEVDAAFVYATDARLMPGKVRVALTVPTAQPIVYPAAPLAATPHAVLAQRFVAFLLTPPARAVFARHGFTTP